jgi:hypothetical protein
VIRPQWAWEFDDADGARMDRPISPVFANQYDAEEWLGEHWRELATQGVETARLMNAGTQATPSLVLRVP